jgi:hypothetical protein
MELRRNSSPIRMRNYGRIVQDMIAYASSLPAGQERETLEIYVAQCMRQRNMVWNKDQESGIARVREDILRLSDGKLTCDSPAFMALMNPAETTQQKKKK